MENEKPEKSKEAKRPFKVCFANKNLPGRSNIQIGKPLQLRRYFIFCITQQWTINFLAHIVTDKFYSSNQNVNEDVIQKYLEKLTVQGSGEKLSKPITENQRQVYCRRLVL